MIEIDVEFFEVKYNDDGEEEVVFGVRPEEAYQLRDECWGEDGKMYLKHQHSCLLLEGVDGVTFKELNEENMELYLNEARGHFSRYIWGKDKEHISQELL